MRKHFTGFAFAIAIVSVAHWSFAIPAVTYSVTIPDAQYGHLNQGPPNMADTDGVGPNGTGGVNNYCAPTATMNSFTMLQNRYPNVYGNANQLQGGQGSWLKAARKLAMNMMTDPDTGTGENNWVSGKMNWLNTYAPGKTIFEGQDPLYTGTQAWVDKTTKPTANFLLDMLKKGEDIEIGLTPAGGGTGHVMTLTSISWVDANGDMSFNTGDTLSIDGIDPADPNNHFNYSLNPAANPTGMGFTDGYMTFDGQSTNSMGANYDPFMGYRLDAALAESPVPLPTSFYGGLALFVGLGCYFRLSSRQARAPMV